ncbi:legumain-like isoform X1 [Myxocyprinus asiaticus]|uniref:legumain-like isoform X1 n=1 Tax=Myxocyprinus asiaticus TaxID=70543 RepID=UPI002222F376|nr:legumain-like isoform X1 [Myxocyprinus asiaticus]
MAQKRAEKMGKHWVLLVAGSKTWQNYRHQANVCHAYQIMHQNGIPDEQIVVMMYDDIAYNKKNPHPGKIINKPHGSNVYPRVLKDYTTHDVTPKNFLAVLKGDERAVRKTEKCGPKKVLKSGENDTIFVYLADHGSYGVFCFPDSTLHAIDLIDTINEMASAKKFSKMVIYMESCLSGSMFTHLPNNVHVYTVTASKAQEPSYACYHDTVLKTYLADAFSATWMHYNEKVNLDKATFQSQFDYLQKHVKTSSPCRFGDMTISKCPISEFLKNTPKAHQDLGKYLEFMLSDLTPSHEVPFRILKHRIDTEADVDKRQYLKKKYDSLHQRNAQIERAVAAISQQCSPEGAGVDDVDGDYGDAVDLQELKTVAEHFRTTCFNWHEEEIVLSHMHVFARLCASGVGVERIIEVMNTVRESCSEFQ